MEVASREDRDRPTLTDAGNTVPHHLLAAHRPHRNSTTRAAIAWAAAITLALLLSSSAYASDAGNISKLSQTLSNSSDDKARIAAAVSLGRLNDERALRPLVGALRDDNRTVRAIAASALGRLGNTAALPALQQSTRDRDALVRKRATEAIAAIRNQTASRPAPARAGQQRAGFGSSGHTPRPNVYLAVQSANDESTGRLSDRVRRQRAEAMRGFLLRELGSSTEVTMSAAEAQQLGLSLYNIDVSIIKLQPVQRGPYVEVECEIRVAISDSRGRMMSFLTGGAKVQVPRRNFQPRYLPSLRREALENAVKGVHQDVVSYLRRVNPS